MSPRVSDPDFLARGLKLSHLRLVASLARFGAMQAAAQHLGITQPAASRMAAEIERVVGEKIHRRAGKGIELTAVGQALAQRAVRALREIEDAENDIAEIGRGASGRVRIGSVTGPAIEYVLPVMRATRLAMPRVAVAVEVATSDVLAEKLLQGELDFFLGRLPEGQEPGLFHETPLTGEPVSFLARSGHPLVREAAIPTRRLLDFDWVLPLEGSILRRTIVTLLRAEGLPLPEQVYTTSSFLLTLALLRRSNAVAPVATAVADVFADASSGEPLLRRLDTAMQLEVETFSLIRAAGRLFPPTTEHLYEMTSEIARKGAGR
jgi:DNA-binding transcriptional LysR family regulator